MGYEKYQGGTQVISGLIQENNRGFPIVRACDVLMPDETRLDEFLSGSTGGSSTEWQIIAKPSLSGLPTSITDAIKVLFRIHKNGYEIYKYYLDYCCKKHVEPRLTIEDLEVFFINSYKVPQLKSLCNRYFPSASEEESKKETKKCFKKIFYDLRDKKFLNCSINEFLWAFGLTDK